MKNHSRTPTDPEWQALESRQPFLLSTMRYGVVTTGIVCKPTCPSRRPLRKNTVIFTDPAEAEQAGFRACKRCGG